MRSPGWVLIVTGVHKEEKIGTQTQVGGKKHVKTQGEDNNHKPRGLEHILPSCPQEKPTVTQLCSWP